MNKILSTIVATFVVVPLTTAVFAADATKPVVPAPPVVASQPSATDATKPVVPVFPVVAGQPPAANAAAKNKAARLRERNRNAKAASGSIKKVVPPPASPAVKATAAKRINKLQERNKRAGANTKNMDSSVPKEITPVAPPAVK